MSRRRTRRLLEKGAFFVSHFEKIVAGRVGRRIINEISERRVKNIGSA